MQMVLNFLLMHAHPIFFSNKIDECIDNQFTRVIHYNTIIYWQVLERWLLREIDYLQYSAL